jgi:hypothetical protein
VNHKADAESDTPSPSGFGIHILCVLVVCIPVIIILYPIIVFVSDPFGGSDECHVIGRFKTSHSWALQNQQRCECSVSGLTLVLRARGSAASQCFDGFLSVL